MDAAGTCMTLTSEAFHHTPVEYNMHLWKLFKKHDKNKISPNHFRSIPVLIVICKIKLMLNQSQRFCGGFKAGKIVSHLVGGIRGTSQKRDTFRAWKDKRIWRGKNGDAITAVEIIIEQQQQQTSLWHVLSARH